MNAKIWFFNAKRYVLFMNTILYHMINDYYKQTYARHTNQIYSNIHTCSNVQKCVNPGSRFVLSNANFQMRHAF